jgi:hypothetical protein
MVLIIGIPAANSIFGSVTFEQYRTPVAMIATLLAFISSGFSLVIALYCFVLLFKRRSMSGIRVPIVLSLPIALFTIIGFLTVNNITQSRLGVSEAMNYCQEIKKITQSSKEFKSCVTDYMSTNKKPLTR